MAAILIVEDDRNIRLLTAARLSDLYTVVSVCDGVEALERIYQGGIDLVIADIMMPRMDGFELLRTLRSQGYTMPFLMLTAKDGMEDMEKSFSLGTDDYMTKPFSSDELKWRVSALLRRARIAQNKKIVIGDVWLILKSMRYTLMKNILSFRKKNLSFFSVCCRIRTRFFPRSSCWTVSGEWLPDPGRIR